MSTTTTTTSTAPAEPKYVYFSYEGTFSGRRLVSPSSPSDEQSFTQIPIVDISSLSSPSPSARADVAHALALACERVGFLYITGHGVSPELIEETFGAAKEYFDMPLERKMERWIYGSRHVRGYEPVYGARVDPGVKLGDRNEGFLLGYEPAFDPSPPSLTPERAEMIGQWGNNFPPDLPEFRAKLGTYHAELLKLSRRLMRAFGLALGVGEGYFDEMGQMDAPNTAMKVIHYPPQEVDSADETGIGAHTDFTCFTLLQTTLPGLEVLNAGGHWVQAPPMPGTFIMNVGDFLMRMSNGRFLSTVHRVKNVLGEDRYSIPFFFNTNLDAPVEVLKTCQSPENPPKYPTELVGEVGNSS
ncbi:2OG-Fe-II oxygenase [Calocera viscosa TUFC12733]|uniref:2OG-Fe-II oxygenase n=1 Tax=Calocera viscosa (strain TUFC12733) TaxID=1330018 RepID=A0A167PMA7_CALVF|nr:2OG-Fe-II oxygenase [Calocera viscosa TUFC12733]